MIAILLRLAPKILPLLLGCLSFLPMIIGKGAKAVSSKGFWKDYGKIILVVGACIIGYILYNRWQNGRSLEDVAGHSGNGKRAYSVALVVADYLGTNKETKWYQLSGWYEDEAKATKALLENKDILKLVESKYADISSSGSLRKDIEKLYKSKQKQELFKGLGWL